MDGRRAATVLQLVTWAIRAGSLDALLRALAIAVGARRITPRPGEYVATTTATVTPAEDTGGGYRPKHRPQDPAKDPEEPGGGESSSKGTDHGWSNCSMSSGADAMAYATQGGRTPWGGDLRHDQGDLEGGTDLGDVSDAFDAVGVPFSIKSGAGWDALVDYHNEGRAIVIQGTGNVPGSATFDGGHACCIGAETHSDGRWLWGDPLASDWQWVKPSDIKAWAQRWQSSIAFGIVPAAPTPPPEPPPKPPPPAPVDPTPYDQADLDAAADAAVVAAGDAAVVGWLDWLRAPRPGPADVWDTGAWADSGPELEDEAPCPPFPGDPAHWSRGPVPSPARDAYGVMTTVGSWDVSTWRNAGWA